MLGQAKGYMATHPSRVMATANYAVTSRLLALVEEATRAGVLVDVRQ